MPDKCLYYHFELRRLKEQTFYQGRTPPRPKISSKAICTHPDSMHGVGTNCGPCPCGGDKTRCAIPYAWDLLL